MKMLTRRPQDYRDGEKQYVEDGPAPKESLVLLPMAPRSENSLPLERTMRSRERLKRDGSHRNGRSLIYVRRFRSSGLTAEGQRAPRRRLYNVLRKNISLSTRQLNP